MASCGLAERIEAARAHNDPNRQNAITALRIPTEIMLKITKYVLGDGDNWISGHEQSANYLNTHENSLILFHKAAADLNNMALTCHHFRAPAQEALYYTPVLQPGLLDSSGNRVTKCNMDSFLSSIFLRAGLGSRTTEIRIELLSRALARPLDHIPNPASIWKEIIEFSQFTTIDEGENKIDVLQKWLRKNTPRLEWAGELSAGSREYGFETAHNDLCAIALLFMRNLESLTVSRPAESPHGPLVPVEIEKALFGEYDALSSGSNNFLPFPGFANLKRLRLEMPPPFSMTFLEDLRNLTELDLGIQCGHIVGDWNQQQWGHQPADLNQFRNIKRLALDSRMLEIGRPKFWLEVCHEMLPLFHEVTELVFYGEKDPIELGSGDPSPLSYLDINGLAYHLRDQLVYLAFPGGSWTDGQWNHPQITDLSSFEKLRVLVSPLPAIDMLLGCSSSVQEMIIIDVHQSCSWGRRIPVLKLPQSVSVEFRPNQEELEEFMRAKYHTAICAWIKEGQEPPIEWFVAGWKDEL